MRIRRYTSMIWLHWATALLVAASFAIAWIRKDIDDLDSRAFWLDVHRSIGLLILVLTLARLAWRLRVGALSHRADLPPAMWLASRVTHGLIYASLIAMPLIGWAQSSAAARHLKLFGTPFPALVGHDRDLADTLAAWHENVGWAFLALIGLHALAAIYHHYVRRDDLLRAMLPGYKPPLPEPGLPGILKELGFQRQGLDAAELGFAQQQREEQAETLLAARNLDDHHNFERRIDGRGGIALPRAARRQSASPRLKPPASPP